MLCLLLHVTDGNILFKFQEHSPSKMSKTLSKKQRKMQQLEKHLQEKEFERAFFREFWPLPSIGLINV